MKKVFFLFGVVLLLVVILGADIRRNKQVPPSPVVERPACKGYTIIEFGKGINCDGDTINLVKVPGGQAVAIAGS